MNIWFHIFCQIFAKLFTKNAKGGSDKYEIWHVGIYIMQRKKVQLAFLSNQPFMEHIPKHLKGQLDPPVSNGHVFGPKEVSWTRLLVTVTFLDQLLIMVFGWFPWFFKVVS